jgi:hypothetical protein
VAARPAFTVTVVSAPTNFAPGDGTESFDVYAVRVTNSGGAPTDGSPIVFSDSVPAPLAYDPVGSFAGAGVEGRNDNGSEEFPCSAGPPVTCTDAGVLQPGHSLVMRVPVDVPLIAPASVVDEVSVSGGGAPPVSASGTTAISAAQPKFGFQAFDGSIVGQDGLPDTQAGSHPYALNLAFNLNTLSRIGIPGAPLDPAGNPKEIVTNLPAGLVANPNATLTRCTEAQLESTRCPDSSAVGTVTAVVGIFGVPSGRPAALYNMVPPAGVPAEFAFDPNQLPGLFVHLFGGVRTGGDYGLSSTASDVLQHGAIQAVSVELWGDPSDPSHDEMRGHCADLSYGPRPCSTPQAGRPAFLTLPSACSGPLVSSVSANSWQEPDNFISDNVATHDASGNPVGVTGCASLDFSPSLSVQPDTPVAGSPTGLGVDLRVPQNESPEGLAEANLKKAVVTLPQGMVVSPSAANGLGACSEAQIGLDNAGKPSCPDSSKVGSAEVITPLLGHSLQGSVYVAQQGSNPFGSLLALYLVVEADGAIIKLPGQVSLNPLTGQVTTTFDKSPQLPFSELKLNFFGGPRAALVTPSGCGSYTTTSRLTPWSSETPVEPNSSFQIASGCAGQGFSPSFTAGTLSNQAGGFSPFSVTISRSDQDQDLGGIQVKAPPGMLGMLKSVPLCGEPQAAQGTCGQASSIGHTTVGAGAGPDPFFLGGQVYLTGPYKGSPFGLSVVVPAIAGPFDLGTVVVRAAVSVDPHTAQITVTSDPLPSILQGVPLQIKTVNVTIDREGFTFNPTNCEPLSVGGTLSSVQGVTVGVSSRFEAANCAALAFKPSFTVSTQAGTSKKNGASLDVKVGFPAGAEANIRSVAVTLPKQLPARLTTIQQACLQATFAVNPASCPAGSNIGIGTARTPVLANPVTGPAYLVSHGGASFPDLVVVLQGEGVTLDLTGSINIKKSITSSTFASVPDAPISSFELKLPEGPHSGLAAVVPAKAKGNLCGQALTMPTTLTGQNGAQIKQSTKIAVTGCPKSKKTKAKAKKHKSKRKRK